MKNQLVSGHAMPVGSDFLREKNVACIERHIVFMKRSIALHEKAMEIGYWSQEILHECEKIATQMVQNIRGTLPLKESELLNAEYYWKGRL